MRDFYGTVLHNYRQQTEDMARSPLAGGPRFICPECKTSQPLTGRKSRGHRCGFRCAGCAKKLLGRDE